MATTTPPSAAVRVMAVHVYRDDPNDPGSCVRCRLSDPDRRNAVHQFPDVPEQVEHLRRAGLSE